MPITIAGSGTITGLSAGGLPDASIVTADIADAAITRAKMGYSGAILQVVQATHSTAVNINTSTYTDTGLTGSITPTSASSKILVMINQQARNATSNPSFLGCRLKLLRGSTSIFDFANPTTGQDSFEITADNGGNVRIAGYISVMYLDSPATTSSITYKTQASTNAGTHAFQNNSSPSIMTFFEVAA